VASTGKTRSAVSWMTRVGMSIAGISARKSVSPRWVSSACMSGRQDVEIYEHDGRAGAAIRVAGLDVAAFFDPDD
jgi:hypothetical protein